MYILTLAALLLGVRPDDDPPELGRMSIVIDRALARKHLGSHGVAFDDVFPVRRTEANKVRAAVLPYLRTKVDESSDGDRLQVRSILAGLSLYRWHCAGHSYRSERRLFCIVLSPAVDRDVLRFQKDAAHGLPMIFDGGIHVLNVLFDIDRRVVETFWWNGDA
jgi:hypothetical protein